MKSWFWLPIAALIVAAPFAATSPTQPVKPLHIALPPLTSQILVLPCNPGERTNVIASGEGRAPLALYVYDQHGNCVTRDEATSARTADDLFVEWVPPGLAAFTVEVRNQGLFPNEVDVIVR